MQNRSRIDLLTENLGYYDGSTSFDNWIGPGFPRDNPKYQEVMEAIAKVFQSRRIIAECVDRHRTALVGKKPHWYLVDGLGSRLENNSASVAEKLLQRFINRQARLAISTEAQLQDAIAEAVKNMLVTGRGYLRLWSPRRYRNSGDPILRVCMHSPHPGSVTIQRDSDGFVTAIQYTYIENNKQRKEKQVVDLDSGLTFFTTLDETEISVPEETFYLNLGGQYSVYELRSPPLITESAKQAQDAINFALTMMIRGVEVAGFRERLILGAQPPGQWDDEGRFHPDTQFNIGPGQTSFIQGVPTHDETGQLKGYTSPSVSYAEPVSPQTFIDTVQAFTAVIYHEFKQSHLLGSDLQLSGVSREQARQDFETALGEHVPIIEAAIAGIYRSALMMMIQPEAERYRDLDVMVQLRLNASKLLPEERQENREDYKAGLRSRTTAMAASGIDDQDAEIELIRAEEADRNVVDDVTSLLTTGVIDQPSAINLLKERGRLNSGAEPGNNDLLNGNGATLNDVRAGTGT